MEGLAAGAMQNLGWRNRRLEKSMVVMPVPSVNVVNVTKSQHMTQYNVHQPTCEDSRLRASGRWIKTQGPQQGPCGRAGESWNKGWSETGAALLEARVFQTGLPPPLNPIHRQEPVLVASFVSLTHTMVILEEGTSIKKIHCPVEKSEGPFLD